MVIPLLFGLYVGFSTKWVEVVHQNEFGAIQRSYFADGYKQGWRGLLGGTKQLYQELKKNQKKERNLAASVDGAKTAPLLSGP